MIIAEKTLGVEHPSYSVDLRSLANLLQGQVRGTGCPLVQRCNYIPQMQQQRMMTHSRHRPLDPSAAQGEYDEAEVLYRRAIAITKATLGTDHLSYSIDLNNLAVVRQKQVSGRVHLFSLVVAIVSLTYTDR